MSAAWPIAHASMVFVRIAAYPLSNNCSASRGCPPPPSLTPPHPSPPYGGLLRGPTGPSHDIPSQDLPGNVSFHGNCSLRYPRVDRCAASQKFSSRLLRERHHWFGRLWVAPRWVTRREIGRKAFAGQTETMASTTGSTRRAAGERSRGIMSRGKDFTQARLETTFHSLFYLLLPKCVRLNTIRGP